MVMTVGTKQRPSPIAGLWYSSQPAPLKRQIDAFIDQAELPELSGEVVGVIAPHAGYRYSGRTAGYAFKAVRGLTPDLVVVISPLHNYHHAHYLTSAHSAYVTPLGEVPIDAEAVFHLNQALEDSGGKELTPIANDKEHSLEIELPFLQRVLESPFKLLPIMIRHQSPEIARMMGEALGRTLAGKKALLVASTDLSHFYDQNTAEELDREMLKRIEAFNPEGVIEAELSGRGFACGVAAVASMLWAARQLGANTVRILHHSTSAEETGDYNSVVGYGAAAVLKTG
jgi:MEMO1 family protein